MFDPWTSTLEEAQEAQEVHEAFGDDGPCGAIFQWDGARRIEGLRQDIEEGSGFDLLAAVRVCANHGLVMPEWLAIEFIRRYDRVLNCHSSSWDEVFGRPYPGKHLKKLRNRRSNKFAVFNAINEILVTDPKMPIDKNLFDCVGEQFGFGATYTEDLYRDVLAIIGRTNPENNPVKK